MTGVLCTMRRTLCLAMNHAGSDRVCTAGCRDSTVCPDYTAHALKAGYLADPGARDNTSPGSSLGSPNGGFRSCLSDMTGIRVACALAAGSNECMVGHAADRPQHGVQPCPPL